MEAVCEGEGVRMLHVGGIKRILKKVMSDDKGGIKRQKQKTTLKDIG